MKNLSTGTGLALLATAITTAAVVNAAANLYNATRPPSNIELANAAAAVASAQSDVAAIWMKAGGIPEGTNFRHLEYAKEAAELYERAKAEK